LVFGTSAPDREPYLSPLRYCSHIISKGSHSQSANLTSFCHAWAPNAATNKPPYPTIAYLAYKFALC